MEKDDYLKALSIVEEYQRNINKSLIKPLKCICCKENKVKPLKDGLTYNNISPSKQDDAYWDNGTVAKIQFGYGSQNDTKSFFVAICDNCIEQLEKEKIVLDVKIVYKKEQSFYL